MQLVVLGLGVGGGAKETAPPAMVLSPASRLPWPGNACLRRRSNSLSIPAGPPTKPSTTSRTGRGGGCKPAYGTLGQETRRGHWSADSRRVGSFPTDGRWGTDDGGPDTGGGRLNTLKRAERRQIGRKYRGDGQDACRARNPDESWRGEKEGTKLITTGNIGT